MNFPHRYSAIERATIYRVIAERRDMRHFRGDAVPAGSLLHAAHQVFGNSCDCADAGS